MTLAGSPSPDPIRAQALTPTDNSSGISVWTVVRGRARALAPVFGIVLSGAMFAALLRPSRYTASGTILIEQQERPNQLVHSTVSSYASQRVQIISQRVMTTDNPMGIIRRYDLFAELRRRLRLRTSASWSKRAAVITMPGYCSSTMRC
jgi:hypothetical protein